MSQSCPDDALLLRFVEAADSEPQVTAHVRGCPRCRRCVSRLRREQAALHAAGRALATVTTVARETWSELVPIASTDQGVPKTVGRFVVRKRLATGGQADLLLATHPTLGCDVVVKLGRRRVDDVDEFPGVEQEARALAKLEHAALPRVFDADFHAGRPYLIMQLVEGQRLDAAVGCSTPTCLDILDRMIQLADGVAAAHSTGCLHLDLKPDNVLIGRQGQVKLVDFGAAGLLAGHRHGRRQPIVFGTPEYMAPEQHSGDSSEWTVQTDVYGLGGLLYFQLFGEAPHAGGRSLPTFQRHETSDGSATTPSSEATNDAVRAQLIAICRQMLSPSPAARPATAMQVTDELRQLRREARASLHSRRLMALLLVAGCAMLALSLAAPQSASNAAGSAAELRLSPTLVTPTAAIPLDRAMPLRRGDRLSLEVASPDLAATEVFLVVNPQVIIPCGPLERSASSPHRARFPSQVDGWPIGRLGRFPLLIAIRSQSGEVSALERLRHVYEQVMPQLSQECDLVQLQGGHQAADSETDTELLSSQWSDADAAASVRMLHRLLDESFSGYHAYLFRYEDKPQ